MLSKTCENQSQDSYLLAEKFIPDNKSLDEVGVFKDHQKFFFEPFLDTYLFQKLLKSNNSIYTYLAKDLTHDYYVVLKIGNAHQLPPATLIRLEHEGASLNSIQTGDRNFSYRSGLYKDHFFLVAPFIEGLTLEEKLKHSLLSTIEGVKLGSYLAKKLCVIHDRGIMHRDIKPSNIILEIKDDTISDAHLIDFGFSRQVAGYNSHSSEATEFTALYVAPEQSGVIESRIDERSDLYSLGIVLYETLTGAPPFHGKNLSEILTKHLTEKPPSIKMASADGTREVPSVFEDIIFRLLAKDPRDRYQSAEALYADLSELQKALETGITQPVIALGRKDRRDFLTEASFVGREHELQILKKLIPDTIMGHASLSFLEGVSGSGKSRLIEELFRQVRHENLLIIKGQGLDQSASRPYQILAGIALGVIEASYYDKKLKARLQEHLTPYQQTICEILPEFIEFFGIDLSSPPQNLAHQEAFGENRNIAALTHLFECLGSGEKPAIIYLDDCQWADPFSLKFLKFWHHHLQENRKNKKLNFTSTVLSFRSEQVDGSHVIRDLAPRYHLKLNALSLREIDTLVTSMAGPLPEQAIQHVANLCDGSPFMASAILRGMVETATLTPKDDGWKFTPELLDQIQSSRKAAVLLKKRIEQLPLEVLRFLTAGAILGKSFEASVAANLSQINPQESVSATSLARRRQLIWEDPRTGVCRFVHDKIREAFLERLNVEESRRLHLQAAYLIKKIYPDIEFELAYHFDAAGEFALAMPYALKAASKARAQSSLAIAEQQYRIAERGFNVAKENKNALLSNEIATEIAKGLGSVLMLQGRYDEAQREMEKALASTIDRMRSADIQTSLGELAFKRGDMKEASRCLCEALRLLGRFAPESNGAFFVLLVWEIFIQTTHTLSAKIFRRSLEWRKKTLNLHASLSLRIYSRLAYCYWFQRGKIACGWAHLRNMNLSERYIDSKELAQAYSEHAPVSTMIPWYGRGIAYAKKSLSIRKKLLDQWGQGQSASFYGAVLYAASQYEKAIEKCNQAIPLLEQMGDRWEANTAKWHMAYSLYRLGNLKEALNLATKLYQDAIHIGDYTAAGIALSIWAKASEGNIKAEYIQKEFDRNFDDAHTRAELMQANGVRLIYANDPFKAGQVLEEAYLLVKKSGLRQEYVAPILPWLTTALRLSSEALDPLSIERSHILKKADYYAKKGLKLANHYKNNLPHMLREAAYIAAWKRKSNLARKYIQKSSDIAFRQQARYEYALTLAAKGRIGKAFGWQSFNDDLLIAKQILQPIEDSIRDKKVAPIKPTLSLIARFNSLLEGGRSLVTALSEQDIWKYLEISTRKLFHGDKFLLIKASASGYQILTENKAKKFSHKLVEEAFSKKETLSLNEVADNTNIRESLILSNARAVLCAPIIVRDVPIACLYVSHEDVGTPFNSDEIKIATLLTALAGAALENAEGFKQLKLLNESLSLQSEELQKAKEKADLANKAKNEFLANMSHEIRTPLGVVLGFCELMAETTSSQERTHYAEIIHRNGFQLSSLIDDILDFSKIEAGYLKIYPSPTNVQQDLKDILKSFREQAEKKNLKLELSCSPLLPSTIFIDKQRLRQILMNLVFNAIKFTDKGHVRVIADWKTFEASRKPHLSIDVEDTGIGMSPETVKNLFQAFFQADSSSTRKYAGTGLGLVLSRRLAHAMGGDLVLTKTELDVGSTFTLSL